MYNTRASHKNADVVTSFLDGKAARTLNLWTDGKSIYSYAMRIGAWKQDEETGRYCVLVRSDVPSKTTAVHRNKVSRGAKDRGLTVVEVPEVL